MTFPMRIGIAGHISSESIAQFLDCDIKGLPRGYYGAPLLGTLIGTLLDRGHSIFAYTTSSDMQPATRITASGQRFKITYCSARPRAFRYSGGRWGRATDAFSHERSLLRQAMQDDSPDLVHAHWTYEFALAAIESGLPHLVTCHDAPQVVLKYSPDPYRLVRYIMARRVLNQAQNLTAVSPYLKRMLDSYTRTPISIVPNPLPKIPSNFSAIPRQYDPAHPRIAMVLNGWGALKNPKPALCAFASLRKIFPAAELRIMGSDYGADGKARAWAQSQQLTDGVNFLGPQPYSVLLSKMAESDLLLHPALEETFGMSIAEAMSLGIPVVGGLSSGAVPWVIGENGRLVDVRSPEAIALAIQELLSNPGELSSLSASARDSALQRFSPETAVSDYEICYKNVLNKEAEN